MRRRARARWLAGCVGLTLLGAAGLAPGIAVAAPPQPQTEAEAEPEPVTLEGRVRESGGTRAPVSGAVVLLVDAPEDVRPGQRARDPLDPEAVTWMRRAETDQDGHFVIEEVPPGMLRVVVVAGGYDRLEQWAEAEAGAAIELFVAPEEGGDYRTEVATDRDRLSPPEHRLDAQAGRRFPGSGDDPVLAALNFPGVARSPGGLGLLSMRGGNPTTTGVYLDGHPVPRAFHTVPIASVLSPPMTDRVELHPGVYGPGYGSFAGGMIEIFSRAGRPAGVHGQAHLDLFDLGVSVEAPVGPGTMHFGLRRSHLDAVLRTAERITGPMNLLLPTYFDYLGRVDMPVGRRHTLTLRALGAGDRLRAPPVPGLSDLINDNLFDFAASFHRFDLDYRYDDGQWSALISPSVRLDSARISNFSEVRREARVVSLRAEAGTDLRKWLRLDVGADLVATEWNRHEQTFLFLVGDTIDPDNVFNEESYTGSNLRLGFWLATTFRAGRWSFTPALRANLFAYVDREFVRVDPRFEASGQLSERVRMFAKLGMFGVPIVFQSNTPANLFGSGATLDNGVADVPDYLVAYFDPGVQNEPRNANAEATFAIQAATGVEASLPWELALRGTLFWRELLPRRFHLVFPTTSLARATSRERAMGFELLLRRALGRKLDGWIGYTLLWARVQPQNYELDQTDWLPAVFDQRHNFVMLLSAALPRGVRVGARFRVVSGNPENTVIGAEASNQRLQWFYSPIRGPRGTTYQPVFHQLDIRVDKRWSLRRTGVTAYLDVQNVYDRRYPEVWLYTYDWSQRASLVGLPIFPSVGVQVDF